jgi:hypothetical protein
MYSQPPDTYAWNALEPDASDRALVFDDRSMDGEAGGPTIWRPHGFIEWFVVAQTLLPALLFLPGSQPYRIPIRTGSYAISLVAFAVWWFHRSGRRRGRHPAVGWIGLMLVWLGLMLLHPDTTPFVGVAQISLYFAIVCPVFWASSYVSDRRTLVRALVLLLVCNGVNSMVGVMQVYDPDRWMPRQLSSVYSEQGGALMLSASTFIGRDGRPMVRPPGLFDAAGAVAGAATVATILGLIFCLEPIGWWKRSISLGFALAGMSALYLSHVRAAFVMTLGMMAAYVVLLTLQNQKKRVIAFGALGVGIVVVGLSVATALGGDSVAERFSTLLEADPRDLYYQSRGIQVKSAMTEMLDEYPLGAGLGRWGMLSFYFGDRNPFARNLFAEVQPNAWMLDGGVPLVALYSLVLIVTLIGDLRLVRALADPEDRLMATIVIAANLGTIGLVFTFIPFGTIVGLQFWFLEGILHGAMADRPRRAALRDTRPYFE